MSIEIEIHAIGGFCNNNNNKSFAIQYSDKVGQYEYIHAHVKPPEHLLIGYNPYSALTLVLQ